MRAITIDKLKVEIYDTRAEMGRESARQAAERIRQLLHEQSMVNIVFAAAPSQSDFLHALADETGIDWNRVHGFHMDEYIGLPPHHEQRFGSYLKKNFFDRVRLGKLDLLNESGLNQYEEAQRYADLIRKNPIDITFMGVGENTHIAFNDPHVANFNDPELVKIVDIDDLCKRQQVNDGCFPKLEDVPSFAYTMTVPALMSSRYIFCMVPARTKAPAVKLTLLSEISETYPATALRKHPGATMYLDADSAGEFLKSRDQALAM